MGAALVAGRVRGLCVGLGGPWEGRESGKGRGEMRESPRGCGETSMVLFLFF